MLRQGKLTQFLRFLKRQAAGTDGLKKLARQALQIYQSDGLGGIFEVASALSEQPQVSPPRQQSYANWIKAYDFDPTKAVDDPEGLATSVSKEPVISVVLFTDDIARSSLRQVLTSLERQFYTRWELVLVTDGGSAASADSLFEHSIKNGGVVRDVKGSLSSLPSVVNGKWVLLLWGDRLLRENTLLEFAAAISKWPDAQMIYADDDKVSANGERYHPHFKPSFSPELLRSWNYIGSSALYRVDLLNALDLALSGAGEAISYDLNLRVFETSSRIHHIPKILFHKLSGSHVADTHDKPEWQTGSITQSILLSHLKRAKLQYCKGLVELHAISKIEFDFADGEEPLVSLVIATRDRVDLLERCISSVLGKTDYESYEIIIVDNASKETITLDYLGNMAASGAARVIRCPGAFNYSKIANLGVHHANGDVIALLNNDVEVISPNWLTEMVGWAVQPDIGCVGAKLLYGDDTVQHAGVVLGVDSVAGHAHRHVSRFDAGYMGRAQQVQNFSAVTGAVMVVEKQLFLVVDGFDEKDLPVAYNDVDFCLRIQKMGFRNVWTPFAELYHHEGKTRGLNVSKDKILQLASEAKVMRSRWAAEIANDPFYSPNLSLNDGNFNLEN